MDKQRLLSHYYENIQWSIFLDIKYIRIDAYPGKQYWLQQLKNDLKSRKVLIKKINSIPVQIQYIQTSLQF